MRIIGGKYKGRRLFSPQNDAIRPTSDRVRESLFNILLHDSGFSIADMMVLDLFCGSGALGIETLSRGAQGCIFVDADADSLALCRRNAETVTGNADLLFLRQNAMKAAGDSRIEENSIGLVFADPPYGKNLAGPALAALIRNGKLKNSCYIVVEMAVKSPEENLPPELDLRHARNYGTSAINIYRYDKK